MTKDVEISITEITIRSGKQDYIHFQIDGRRVEVPVDSEIKAYFNAQFVREKPTKEQRKKFATVTNIMRAAYLKGLSDAK